MDAWHTKKFGELTNHSTSEIDSMFEIFEASATWPEAEQEVITTLIPKEDGGLRPIALFRTAYRVYAKYRSGEVKTWAQHHSGYQCNTAHGRCVGDSTWRAQVITATDGQQVYSIEALKDVRKAFEHVRRDQLLEMGVKTGYPLPQLIMSLRSYQWNRRIHYEGIVSEVIKPKRGIAAGSAFATFELWCLLRPAIAHMQKMMPPITICLHVDELCMMANDKDWLSTMEQIDEALDETDGAFRGRSGCPMAR